MIKLIIFILKNRNIELLNEYETEEGTVKTLLFKKDEQ